MNICFMFNGCERIFANSRTNKRVLYKCACVCVHLSLALGSCVCGRLFVVHCLFVENVTNNEYTYSHVYANRRKTIVFAYFFSPLLPVVHSTVYILYHISGSVHLFENYVHACVFVPACLPACMLLCPLREWLRKLRKLSANSFWSPQNSVYINTASHTPISLVFVNILWKLSLLFVCNWIWFVMVVAAFRGGKTVRVAPVYYYTH